MPGYNAARGLLRRYGIRTHFERPAVAHLSGWSLAGASTGAGTNGYLRARRALRRFPLERREEARRDGRHVASWPLSMGRSGMYPAFHRIRPESFKFFWMFTETSLGLRDAKKPPSTEIESGGKNGVG